MQYQKIGPYILLQRIASGGMANIFLAKKSGPNNLNSFYAIKKILAKYAEMPEFHKMFHEEAKVTNAIGLDIHKNVMTSATYEKIGNHYIFVMEYIKGLNLKYFLKLAAKKEIFLSTESILYIIAEIASGLNHLHNIVNLKTGQPLNLIHRDISPQNVMISHNGQIKIIDFGIAKASILEETQVDSGIKGKMAYMSPEQATGGSLDARSDIFSLGIVLWELLSKKRLFLADSSISTLRNVRDCQIPDLKTFNPNISAKVERIVKKSLAKNKEARYKHATDFAQDLYTAIQEQKSFSSYNFEKLSKQIYADDIIKNRRLLAKYINIADDKKTSIEDITTTGMDVQKIDKEDTCNLSLKNLDLSNKKPDPKNINLQLNTASVYNYKLNSQSKHLASSALKKITRTNIIYKNYKNARLSNLAQVSQSYKTQNNSSSIFTIGLSLFLAISGFFFFSSNEQQNTVLKKTLFAVHYIKSAWIKNNTKPKVLNLTSPILTTSPIQAIKSSKTKTTFLTYFNTIPSGVEIFINNKPVGISPNNILLPKNKLIKITLKKDKHATEELTIHTSRLLKKYRQPASINSRIQINQKVIIVKLNKLKAKTKLIK